MKNSYRGNDNRIVRIFNDDIHEIVKYVSRMTNNPYQKTFDALCNYLVEGHTIGMLTPEILIKRILEARTGAKIDKSNYMRKTGG